MITALKSHHVMQPINLYHDWLHGTVGTREAIEILRLVAQEAKAISSKPPLRLDSPFHEVAQEAQSQLEEILLSFSPSWVENRNFEDEWAGRNHD